MAQGDTGGSEGGSWSVGAPSLENFKSNVRSIVDTLRDSLSLTNDNRSAVAQELSSTISSVAASVAERKDQIVTTGIAHTSALASDIGDHVEEGEKAVAQVDAFVRREPLWALAGLGALVTVISLRRGPVRAVKRGIFTTAAAMGFLASMALAEDENEPGLPRD